MIHCAYAVADLAGADCGIYGHPGRYQLFVEGGDADDGDPRLEGDNAHELETEAVRLGAVHVVHWYQP